MPAVARLGDPIEGTTAGEHSGHVLGPHGPEPITGSITGGCASTVFVNGEPACIVGATTDEKDACCGSTPGSVSVGNSSVIVEGSPICTTGVMFSAHNGEEQISSGSPNVFCG